MTKVELLLDLAARDGIADLIGTPTDVTPSGDVGVVAWYAQAVWEVQGDAAVKKTITFYVIDEGLPAEVAYYKDAEPQSIPIVTQNALYSWMRDTIDADPDGFKAVQIHAVSERWEMVVYSILGDDGASALEWQTFYVRRGAGAPVRITNHEQMYLNSLFRV